MHIEKAEIIEGIKTFFVVPDLSLMPEDFLPNFFLKGFEVYYVMDDQHLDIPSKMEILFSLFPEIILFFNIDRKLGNMEWPSFIAELKRKHEERAKIGILYGKHIGEAARLSLEKLFLYNIGIYCGCIPIEYRKAKNLVHLLGVLTANEARGRRKSLRAICGETCEQNFLRESVKYKGRICDISISHFSCSFEGRDPELKMYERVTGIQLKLAGIICTADGVVFTKRELGGILLYVFIFRDSRNRDGLDPDVLGKVNGFIHGQFQLNVQSIVKKAFEEGAARKLKERLSAKA